MRPLHWKIGIAAAVLVLASGGIVIAQQPPPPSEPVVETPPQEPPPKDVPSPPVEKGPDIIAPAQAGPAIKAPDEHADKDDDNSSDDSKSDNDDNSDDNGKAADSTAVVVEPPGIRARHGGAIIQALDKITAETMRFEVPIGKPVRYKDLVFLVRSCETSSPEETLQDSMAYMEVRSEPKIQSGEAASHRVFGGWMFASSPGLDALQHPVYDAWLIACKA